MTLNISESCSEGIRCSVFLSFISSFFCTFSLTLSSREWSIAVVGKTLYILT